MTDPEVVLDPARIERVLAPFAGAADRVLITAVDAAGRPIATSSPSVTGAAASNGDEVVRDILCSGTTIGRLVATGPAAGDPTTVAALEAMAAGLGQLAEADLHRLASELAQGRLQQRSFVSLHAPDVPGYDLASHYEAAREIGGDFFELFQQPRPGRPIGVVIADVTGKGIAAGMLMAFARPVIHAALDASNGPADALERTNRILVEEIRSSLFITAIAGTLDVPSGHIRMANAGHELPLLVPADGGPIVPVGGSGVLLGAFQSLGVGEQEVRLRHGDILLLYTDGVTDAMSSTGERFGEPRMLATIEATRRGTATEVVNGLRDAVSDFRGTVPPADDITIVAIGRRAP
jgi:sigma-B regulation protein RsbU (phosphoserine phosphatase)